MILEWISTPGWTLFVQALLHTLWQGALIAAALALALRHLSRPVARYRCSFAALGAIILSGLVTWSFLNRPLSTSISDSQTQSAAKISVSDHQNYLRASSQTLSSTQSTSDTATAVTWPAWLAILWLAGAAVMLTRAGLHLAGAEKLRRASRPLDDQVLNQLLDDARRTIGLARRVRLAVTDQLTTPAIIGFLVPTLTLPLQLTTTLAPDQIRLVILHELAHVRRGDYFATLFQLLAEALLFFNPAVWFVSRQIRLEREACCDALAVELSGAPADYARTLVHIAETALTPTPATALAFGDKHTLTDRISRLLVPGYRPALRLSWRATIGVLFVGSTLFLISALGTRVALAAILTTQQRIDRITQKMTELGEPLGEIDPDATSAHRVSYAGDIQTADGSPIPKDIYFTASSARVRSSEISSAYAHDGRFSGTIGAGTIYFSLNVPGFAPVVLGPLDGLATNAFPKLQIIVDRGFTAILQAIDADTHQPIPNALVSVNVWKSNHSSPPTNTTADGSLLLPHSADLPLDTVVNARGYELTFKTFDHVTSAQPLQVALHRGQTATGSVLDKSTGKPIAGAEIHLRYLYGPSSHGAFDLDDPLYLLAKTDSTGAFRINQLSPGTSYHLRVIAPNRENFLLRDVIAGRENLIARLGPPLVVHGRLVGTPEELRTISNNANGSMYINFAETYANSSFGTGVRIQAHFTNGYATFAFTNPVAGEVNYNGETRQITDPVDDWVIDLDKAHHEEMRSAQLPRREVIFRFHEPSGLAPKGTVVISIPDNLDPNHLTVHDVEFAITNSEVHVQIPIGGLISITPQRLIGYWFNRFGKDSQFIGLKATNGPGPMVIDIPLIPAGAIYARASRADHRPIEHLFFGLAEVKRAPDIDPGTLVAEGGQDASGDYAHPWVSGPLPLGGIYRVHVWNSNSFCVSAPIKLTDAKPDAELDLQFPLGKTATGLVFTPEGQPLQNAELNVACQLVDGNSFGLSSIFTDAAGRFHLDDATPEFGSYSLHTSTPNLMAENIKLTFASSPQIIRLKPGRKISGRVVEGHTGYILPNALINAFDTSDANSAPSTAHSEATGRFQFTTLGSGKYTFFVNGGQSTSDAEFYADGRTNLLLSVKLYPGSSLKPEPAPSN